MRPARRLRNRAILATPCALAALALGCQNLSRVTPSPQSSGTKHAPARSVQASSGIKPDTQITRASFQAEADGAQQVGLHLDLGRGHEQQGQTEVARGDYERAVDLVGRPEVHFASQAKRAQMQATAHRRLAVVLDRLGQFTQSEAHFRAAMKAGPYDSKVWNNAGYSFYIQGRFAESEKFLRTAHKLVPDDPQVANNLGLVLAAAGKTDESYRMLAQSGGQAAAYANLGYVLASTGQPGPAADQYRRALQLQPDHPSARAGLARLERGSGDRRTTPADLKDQDVALTRSSVIMDAAIPKTSTSTLRATKQH